jgi:hypothetical protein
MEPLVEERNQQPHRGVDLRALGTAMEPLVEERNQRLRKPSSTLRSRPQWSRSLKSGIRHRAGR